MKTISGHKVCLGGRSLGVAISKKELIPDRAVWEQKGLRLVLTCGRFDLLHPGHIRLLEQARSLGDVLVVAVESDTDVLSAAEITRGRGIAPASERAEVLAALSAVDFAFEAEGSSEPSLVSWLCPDVVVKGGSESQQPPPRQLEAGTNQARTAFVWVPLEPGYSTVGLLERIRQIPT